MKVVQRSTSNIMAEVAKPAANAENPYSRMLHKSTRRRPKRSVR